MAMSKGDFIKLKLMMKATTSPHEADVLAAIRTANDLLTRYSLTWEDVFNRVVTVGVGEPQPHRVPTRAEPPSISYTDDEINAAFELVLAAVPEDSGFRNFINSLHSQWQENHRLSDRQLAALFKAVENAKNPRRRSREPWT